MRVATVKCLKAIGLAAAAAAGIALTPSAHAVPLNIMPMGDSVTLGEGSTDGNGWRGPLQGLLNTASVNYDFVGTFQNGTPDIDRDHYGTSGILAFNFGNVNRKGISQELVANNVFSTLQAAGQAPDEILLHIGTNRISELGSGDLAGTELDFLLAGLTTTDPTDSRYIGVNNNNLEIVLARMIPKTGWNGHPNRLGGVYANLSMHRAVVKSSFDYNYGGPTNLRWTNGLASVATNQSQYLGRVRLVDMFRIDVDSLDLNVLLANFGTSLGVTTTGEIHDLLSPDDDLLNGSSADWVDWVLNYDEVNNTFGSGTDGRNLNLYASGDRAHPNDLGYAVMAQVWYTQGLGPALAIPEPASLTIGLVLSLAVIRRARPRPADRTRPANP